MPSITERYAEKPNMWNLSIVITVGGILWAALAFFVSAELRTHSNAEAAHPSITGQLQEIRSDQLKEQILKMDERICAEPSNNYYREELLNLITKWEKLNKPQKFPTQLLRCGK